jgi:two-component system phosphate regulon sensor histidine kinase PhoR
VRTDEARKRSLQVIDKEARRLSHLVDNILQFSSAERGQTDVRMARTPLYPLVREIVDQFRPMMKDGRLVISSDVGDDVEVTLDVDAFRQMFVNLLDNAVKYSPPGGNVDVRLFTGEGRVNVAVEDRGPGIPESEKDRIWEPYYRTSTMTDQAIGGTGLGLAVVNELARLQAAHVSTSAREGGGARFTIGFELAA